MATNILWKLAGSLWMLIFSSMTFNKIGEVTLLGLLVMPETLIYLIFGLFHALLALVGRETAYNHFQIEEKLSEKLLGFISDTILYSTFYRMVLLPACGFGYIEWAILLLFFAQEFGIHFHIKMRSKNDVVDEKQLVLFNEEKIYDCGKEKFVNPGQLTIMGMVLWGFKIIIRYFLPQNLYHSLAENKTVMNIILILVAILGLYGVKRLFEISRLGKKEKSTVKGIAKITTKTLKAVLAVTIKATKALGSAILGAITGPAAIVVIIVLVVVFGLGSFFFVYKIHRDLTLFIGGILSKVLSTDNAGYTETNLNTIGQCLSIIIFFVVQITETYFFKKQLQCAVEEKWFESIENAKTIPQKNVLAIQKILRKQILRSDISKSTKQKSYEILTKNMTEEEKAIENEGLVRGLLD